jgi:hypothetical protein
MTMARGESNGNIGGLLNEVMIMTETGGSTKRTLPKLL